MKQTSEQPSLFDFLPDTLIIGKQTEKILSKTQQTFNRLSKKIENLQDRLQNNTKILDECLQFYGSTIYPLELETLTLQKEVTKLLYQFYINKKLMLGNFGKNKRRILKDIIRIQLENILCSDKNEPDEEIKNIYQTVFGVRFETAAKEGLSEMIDEMESMFSSMGLDIDLSDIDMKSSEEDIFRKMKEIEENMKKEIENKQERQSAKKKTRKQLEREAKEQQIEEAHNRNINSIYKQLAKVLHPDLEQDVRIKEEKESLMKQLTAAYKTKDLYTLLRLEIQWIHKESSHLETLSEEKLEIYNKLLKQQIKELEEEHNMLIFNPRYLPLKDFSHKYSLPTINKLASKKNQMQEIISTLNISIKRFKSDNPLVELRNIIDVFSNQSNYLFSDDF